jgi:hypothetical protein
VWNVEYASLSLSYVVPLVRQNHVIPRLALQAQQKAREAEAAAAIAAAVAANKKALATPGVVIPLPQARPHAFVWARITL